MSDLRFYTNKKQTRDVSGLPLKSWLSGLP